MSFVVFTALSFVVLRLTTRLRWRTLLWLAVAIGLLADTGLDWLVMVRTRA